MFGDGLWIREPSAAGLRAFGMARDELADGVDGFAALGCRGRSAGRATSRSSSDAEWDAYEARLRRGASRTWAAAHPDDPERDEFVARSAMMADSYRDWRRDAFGFAIGRFRRAAGLGPRADGQAEMTPTMISSSRARGVGAHDAGGIELGERLVAIAAGLVAGVLAGPGPLQDGDDLGDLVGGRRRAGAYSSRSRARSSGPACSSGVDDRQGLLAVGDVRRLLAGRVLGAPDARAGRR